MDSDKDTLISQQRERLFSSLTVPSIVKPCTLSDGILSLEENEVEAYRKVFRLDSSKITYFIPASGTGSRMFDFLQQFLGSSGQEQQEEVQLFLSKLSDFAFFSMIQEPWCENLRSDTPDLLGFCEHLLGPKGLHFSALPKALFPFHKLGEHRVSPLEGHLRLGNAFCDKVKAFHFTIQEEHVPLIRRFVQGLHIDFAFEIDFSVQSPESDSYVFDEFQRVLSSPSGDYLRRPAGHGALIENLSSLNSDLILIKNIDNIQCPEKDDEVNACWELLSGVYLSAKQALMEVFESRDKLKLEELNHRFKLFDEKLLSKPWDILSPMLQRPLRVCGMVPNEGMAGGGPFWLQSEGFLSKQIIEKSQIDPAQLSILSSSTHFNPVMLVTSSFDALGKPFNFQHFVKEDMSMAVKKNHFGNSVYYLEKPGLWNGSMYHWNSIFVEIPSTVFSPVKNVMDLLNPRHACSSSLG
ncbi:MAG: hypothetical protein RLZZ68_693 [Bacteroidota bacterium]|jgi:hypothetical protein|nr:DUF4301 family protein [Flavobacteriia bacterium]